MASMTALPSYLRFAGHGAVSVVSLAKCLNCGKTKAFSDPCCFDHLWAVQEFKRDFPVEHPLHRAASLIARKAES